jgi:hypothetical protein
MVSHVSDHPEAETVPKGLHILGVAPRGGVHVEFFMVHRFVDETPFGETFKLHE